MEEKINQLEANLSTLSIELIEIKNLIGAGFKKVDANFDSIKNEIGSLNSKIEILTKKVNSLEGNTIDGFDGVGLKLESLSDEIAKIGIVTKYDEEINNLRAIK
jgi:archaellum component FlaC